MLGVEDSTSLRRALVLLTVVRHFWSQLAPHVSMSPAAVFRAVQGSCPALLFKAWKLSQEFRLAADWHQNLPPTLLAVEQQELSSAGHMVWRPVEGSKIQFVLGTPVRLRCWIWGADPQRYVWSLNGATQPSAAWLCPLHNVLKSEIVVNAPGTYQCVATSAAGPASQPTNVEVCVVVVVVVVVVVAAAAAAVVYDRFWICTFTCTLFFFWLLIFFWFSFSRFSVPFSFIYLLFFI